MLTPERAEMRGDNRGHGIHKGRGTMELEQNENNAITTKRLARTSGTALIVNETLAKGLAKRCARERDEYITTRLKFAFGSSKPTGMRRGPQYRYVVNAFHRALKDEIILEQVENEGRKSETTAIFFWDKVDESLGIVFVLISRKQAMNYSVYKIMCVSKHAVSRIYERMNSSTLNVVMQELKVVCHGAMTLMQHEIDPGKLIGPVMLPTEHGLAILDKRDGEAWTVATWISKTMFDAAQLKYYNEHYARMAFSVRTRPTRSNTVHTRTFSLWTLDDLVQRVMCDEV